MMTGSLCIGHYTGFFFLANQWAKFTIVKLTSRWFIEM